jgi:hypothetical protein
MLADGRTLNHNLANNARQNFPIHIPGRNFFGIGIGPTQPHNESRRSSLGKSGGLEMKFGAVANYRDGARQHILVKIRSVTRKIIGPCHPL